MAEIKVEIEGLDEIVQRSAPSATRGFRGKDTKG